MRKAFVLLLTLLFALSVGSPVFAQDTKNTGELREFISKKWPGLFQRLEKKKVFYPAGLSGTPKMKAGTVQSAVKNALTKFEQREYQYQAFIEKLKSRRDKLAADGKDVTKINALITQLEARHEELKDKIQTEKDWMSTLNPDDMTPAKWAEAKPRIDALRKEFKAHQAEVEKVVKALKEQSVQTKKQLPSDAKIEFRKKMVKPSIVVPPPQYKVTE